MKSWHVRFGGGLESLRQMEAEDPTPAHGEALIRVKAAGLNARDLMILRGVYPLPVMPELIPLADGAGEVAALGEGVSGLKVGDRVVASVFPRWDHGPFTRESSAQIGGSLPGMLAEFATVPASALLPVPDHLSFEEAAALPCAALTAWNALNGGAGLKAGETVLTLGSGGVSLFALQFSKLSGAKVVATTSSAQKAARLKALGADAVINYLETPDWQKKVLELTGGRGVDHIVEVGGLGTLAKSVQSVVPGGEIALVGALAAAESPDPRALFSNVYTLRRIAVGSTALFRQMSKAIGQNGLRPVIDRIFLFQNAREAYEHYSGGNPFGKVVVRC